MNRATHSIVLGLALLFALQLSLMAGQVWINPFGHAGTTARVILAQLRLPRAVLAVVVGGGLGAAGAAMQGYLRNPLADPYLLGSASGASLGVGGGSSFCNFGINIT
jgi:iron complex transport system permease protein